MTTYYIRTIRETYTVNELGQISRPSIRMCASGQWTVRGATRFNNFGHCVEYIPFPECMKLQDWRHANGKPKWRLSDLDHGTYRTWGETVISTGEANA